MRPNDRVKSVDVLAVIDGEGDLFFVDVLRQRQLHDEAVHIGVVIEALYDVERFGFGDFRRAPDERTLETHLFAGPDLGINVNFTCGVFADEHGSEVGNFSAALANQADFGGQFGLDIFGQ